MLREKFTEEFKQSVLRYVTIGFREYSHDLSDLGYLLRSYFNTEICDDPLDEFIKAKGLISGDPQDVPSETKIDLVIKNSSVDELVELLRKKVPDEYEQFIMWSHLIIQSKGDKYSIEDIKELPLKEIITMVELVTNNRAK